MHIEWFSDAVEEVGYEGFEGCTFGRLLELLVRRHPDLSNRVTEPSYQTRLITYLCNHSQVTVTREGESVSLGDEKIENIDCLQLNASQSYIYSLLNLWVYPDLRENEVRIKMLLAIAKMRYQGYWQYALAKDLNLDPKTVFQHLKPFYRYEMVVRLSLILPQGLKKTESGKAARSRRYVASGTKNAGQLSASGVLWLRRFFDVARVPRDLIQIHMTQQVAPFRKSVLRLLEQQPNQILLERDFRAFFLSFFLTPENQGTFLCSPKTVARFFLRMRRELSHQQIIKRVRAWCPQTAKIEMCVKLCKEVGVDENDLMSGSKGGVGDDDTMDDGEDVISTNVMPVDSHHLQSHPVTEEGAGDDPFMDDEGTISPQSPDNPLNALSLPKQIYELIRVAGRTGIVTPDIASCLKTTTKRLTKVLSSLEHLGVVTRKAQRQGKYFMYRYHLKEYCPEESASVAAFRPSESLASQSDGRGAARKTVTEQFCQRLDYLREWIHEVGVCMVPDLARRFALLEHTDHGPDRKTVLRLANVALEQDTNIKKGTLTVGAKKTQELLFFFHTDIFANEDQAAIVVKKNLSDKRSEACREALRRNNEVTHSLQDRNDAETLKMIGAIEDDNRRIEAWEAGTNPITKFGRPSTASTQPAMISDLHVEPRLHDTIVDKVTSKHDQRLLAHYGYLFPVMIRMKYFHIHLMNLIKHKSMIVEETESTMPVLLSMRSILDEMTLDTFLRLIGYGHRDSFVEAYLHGATPRCPSVRVRRGENGPQEVLMKELPSEVYHRLVSSGKAGLLRTQNRRNAYKAVHRLMTKMYQLHLVTQVARAVCDDPDEAEMLISAGNETGAGTRVAWAVKTHVVLKGFIQAGTEAEEAPHLGLFNMLKMEELEAYWNGLKNQVEMWIRRHSLEGKHVAASGRRGTSRFVARFPVNCQLHEAFSKKNWKGQILLGAESRIALDSLADLIVRKSEDKNIDIPNSPYILNPQSEDIKKYAQLLHLTPDAIVRYLLRYFATAGNANLVRIATGRTGAVALHTSRDLRYRCHVCGLMYAQKPSMAGHYGEVHGMGLPNEDSLYVLPAEMERRKRRAVHDPMRRKRRRKMFGNIEGKNHLDFAGQDRQSEEQHISSLLSCVSVSGKGDVESSEGLLKEMASDKELETEPRVASPSISTAWWMEQSAWEKCGECSLPRTEIESIAEIAVMSSDSEVERNSEVETPKFLRHQSGKENLKPATTSTMDDRDESLASIGKKATRVNDLSVEARRVLSQYRLSAPERTRMKRFLQDARRDDEYALIAFLVVMERLRAALDRPSLSNDAGGQFGRDLLPPLTDPLWILFAACQSRQSFPPAAAYFIVQYSLHRYQSSLNLRILSTYRRLSGTDLHETLMAYSLPLKTSIRDLALSEVPRMRPSGWRHSYITQGMSSESNDKSTVRITLARNMLKAILLSQSSRYRPWWACDATRDILSDSETSMLWRWWNAQGFVVLSKRAMPEVTTLKELDASHSSKDLSSLRHLLFWELMCRRRHNIARSFQVSLFGRLRDWRFYWRQAQQLRTLRELKETATELALGECAPLRHDGLAPPSAAALSEAFACHAIDLACCWAQPEVADFPAQPDFWDGFPEVEEIDEENSHTNLAAILTKEISTALLTTAQETSAQQPLQQRRTKVEAAHHTPPVRLEHENDPLKRTQFVDTQLERAQGVDTQLERVQSVNTQLQRAQCVDDRFEGAQCVDDQVEGAQGVDDQVERVQGVDDQVERVQDQDLSDVSELEEEESDEEDVDRGGVQRHILEVTKNAPDIRDFWWRFSQVSSKPEPARLKTSLICWDAEISASLCGLTAADMAKASVADVSSIEPWLLPTNLNHCVALSDPKALNRHLSLERHVEFDDDAVNKWGASERGVSTAEPVTGRRTRGREKSVAQSLGVAAAAPEAVKSVRGDAKRETSIGEFFSLLSSLVPQHVALELAQSDPVNLVSSLLVVHRAVYSAAREGVARMDLLKEFCTESLERYKSHEECHRDFEVALEILMTLRAIVSCPCVSDWQLLAPEFAHAFCLRLRQVKRSANFIANILAGGLAAKYDALSASEANECLLDPVVRPRWIPSRLWTRWGPVPGTLRIVLNAYSGTHLSVELREALAAVLIDDQHRASELSKAQVQFADLRSALAEADEVEPAEKFLFLTTDFLTDNYQPASIWTRLDGRFNSTLTAFVATRVYQLLKDTPNLCLSDINKKLPFIDRCELHELLHALVADNLLTILCFPRQSSTMAAAEAPPSGHVTSRQQSCLLDSQDPCFNNSIFTMSTLAPALTSTIHDHHRQSEQPYKQATIQSIISLFLSI